MLNLVAVMISIAAGLTVRKKDGWWVVMMMLLLLAAAVDRDEIRGRMHSPECLV